MKRWFRAVAIMLSLVLSTSLGSTNIFAFTACASVVQASATTSTDCSVRNRIIEVANAEIGYTEQGNNITKYGTWYGNQFTWCAIFVAWCANQAGVPTSVIERTASPEEMQSKFSEQGRYYTSPSKGGTTAPQPGDIYFWTDGVSTYSHVGIIVNVDSSYIYTVDGNWGDRVAARTISRNHSQFIGFGRPAYPNHNYIWNSNATQHWSVCNTCGATTSRNAHVITWQSNQSYHWGSCRTCGYQISSTEHSMAVNGTNLVCSDCGYTVPFAKNANN